MPAPNHARWKLALFVMVLSGCAKQDTEILTRVGRKIADKSQAATAGLRDKLPFKWSAAKSEPSLADQIQQRLGSDKLLAGTKIDVVAHGPEVELKGIVDKDEQKVRAFDLAETTQGVEKVIDSLQVRGDKNTEN
jgi:osmotically-inducible protein OsmY